MTDLVDDQVLIGADKPSAAFLVFNISLAKNPDSEKIERLVQEVALGVTSRAAEREMTLTEVLCVAEEFMARMMVSAAMASAKDHAAVETWFDDVIHLIAARAVELLHGKMPGAEPGN